MEIRARYALVGGFALAAIAAGFAFVYWLNSAASFRQRDVYLVRYDSPVPGLLVGSAVLFNGIRVGEVKSFSLDAAAPGDVTVEIAVERQAPVRADTRIGIEFQGLTGSPVVSLSGGTASLPLLSTVTGRPPVLVAEKNAGLGMTQAARDVLRSIDEVVKDNSQPLRSLIANLDKFAGALARNSDRIDGIVAGIERMTGGGAKAQVRVFDLSWAKSFPTGLKRVSIPLHVIEPTTLSVFDTEKVVVRLADGRDAAEASNARWPDMLPKVVQARMTQSFEAAGFTGVLARVPEGTRSDFQLVLDIRSFQVRAGTPAVADVELAAKIIGPEGRLVDARVFHAGTPVTALDAEVASAAISRSFEAAARDIVVWTASKF